MAEVIFSQSGGELRIQDGVTHEMSAMLEKQHGVDFHGDANHAKMQLKDRYLQCPVVLNGRGPSCIKTERLGSDCSLDRVVQSIMGR